MTRPWQRLTDAPQTYIEIQSYSLRPFFSSCRRKSRIILSLLISADINHGTPFHLISCAALARYSLYTSSLDDTTTRDWARDYGSASYRALVPLEFPWFPVCLERCFASRAISSQGFFFRIISLALFTEFCAVWWRHRVQSTLKQQQQHRRLYIWAHKSRLFRQ